MTNEKIIVPMNGYIMLFITLAAIIGGIIGIISIRQPWVIAPLILGFFMVVGLQAQWKVLPGNGKGKRYIYFFDRNEF